MKRIAPHYPALPIMLANRDGAVVNLYAPFLTEPFRKVLELDEIDFELIDLDTPVFDDSELPF